MARRPPTVLLSEEVTFAAVAWLRLSYYPCPKVKERAGWVQKGSSASGGVFASLPVPVQRREGFAKGGRLGRKVPPHAQKRRPAFFLFTPCDAARRLAETNAEQELVAQLCWCLWEKTFSLDGIKAPDFERMLGLRRVLTPLCYTWLLPGCFLQLPASIFPSTTPRRPCHLHPP